MLTQEVIVAGFHRSGTSLLTQLLHSAGLFVGDDLIGAMPSNPFGHFEDRLVVRLHDAILEDNGLNWQVYEPFIPVISRRRWDQMSQIVTTRRIHHDLWGFKDPRVCLFLPHWQHLMPGARIVAVFRHPRDSIYSLERRHARELALRQGPAEIHRRFFEVPDLGLRMWTLHNRLLADFIERNAEDAVLIPFHLLTSGFPVVEFLSHRFRLSLKRTDTFTVFDPSVTSTRATKQTVIDPATLDEALELWTRLEELSEATLRERTLAQ